MKSSDDLKKEIAEAAFDDLKKEIAEAGKTSNNSKNEYHEAARNIVNIQRQFFYGEESPSRRLSKVKQIILDAVKKGV